MQTVVDASPLGGPASLGSPNPLPSTPLGQVSGGLVWRDRESDPGPRARSWRREGEHPGQVLRALAHLGDRGFGLLDLATMRLDEAPYIGDSLYIKEFLAWFKNSVPAKFRKSEPTAEKQTLPKHEHNAHPGHCHGAGPCG